MTTNGIRRRGNSCGGGPVNGLNDKRVKNRGQSTRCQQLPVRVMPPSKNLHTTAVVADRPPILGELAGADHNLNQPWFSAGD